MQILIFRHGEKQKRIGNLDTEGNRSICLSEKGIQQIEGLSRKIHDRLPEFIGLKQIYSSTFPRAIQSAEIVRNILSIKEIRPSIIFKELYAFENYSLPKEKRQELHRYALENLRYITSCGYSFGDRAIEALGFIKDLYPSQERVIISAHGGLIRAILLTIDSKNRDKYLNKKINEGEYVIINFDGDKFLPITTF